ncbi:MAG: phenylacetate--CoA ligase family protein [Cellvibrionaceae bacterium]
MSLFEAQLAELSRWKPVPKWRGAPVFRRLLDNEFSEKEHHDQRIDARLRNLIHFCGHNVPYYRRLFDKHQIGLESIKGVGDLERIPILDRSLLQANSDALKAERLPPNETVAGSSKTSGSTGQPVEVVQTLSSFRFFTFLKHRESRWWGMDPLQTMASIRPAVDLPQIAGRRLGDGETIELQGWPFLSNMFRTGPALGFADTNEPERIIEWLQLRSPKYAIAMAAVLEHLSMAVGEANLGGLNQVLSISQQMTPEMRELIEAKLCNRVNENYGFNEVGVVASRCPESGYYHVHSEHCIVEIVDENGQRCKPGVSGRVVVTALNNPAMPLVRYDADDMAEEPLIPCPCGRALPSFTNLRGRYRRTAHLPRGTWDYWGALLDAISVANAEQLAPLKQYQLRQRKSDEFTLTLAVSTPPQSSLLELISSHWGSVDNDLQASLNIELLSEIPKNGKKFQNFVSDLVPDA